MKPTWRLLGAMTVVLAATTACGSDERTDTAAGSPSAQVGGTAPALESRTMEGAPISLASLRGSPVLLNVWATWCHPCQDEIPVLEALYKRHSAVGLKVIGVSIDDAGRRKDVQAFARRFGITYHVWLDPDQRVMPAFSVIGVPTTFLIDASGRLVWRKTGEVKAGDPVLAAALDSVLGPGASVLQPPSGEGVVR